MNKVLLEYIRTYQRVYTRQALDNRLRAVGYTEEEIEVAWQQVVREDAQGQQTATPQQRPGPDRTTFAILIIVLGIGGIAILGLANLALLFLNIGRPLPLLLLINLGIVSAVVAFAWVIVRLYSSSRLPVSQILGLAVSFVVAASFVLFWVVLGSCSVRVS